MAMPERRPYRARRSKDGCYGWRRWDEKQLGVTEWAMGVMRGAVVNRLNLTRVLRQQIEPKLDAIIERLDRLEALANGAGQPTNDEN